MKNKSIRNGIIIAVIVNIIFAAFGILLAVNGFKPPYVALFITSLMIAYHTDVRILIGTTFSLFKSKINVDKKCFVVKEKEFKFLTKLGVKNWKDKFVAWDKSQFILKDVKNKENIEKVLKNNINAEIIHWVSFFVGFLAILIGCLISIDELWIYIITSVATSLFVDLPPILIQRYNRFRLQKILALSKKADKAV